MRWRDGECDGEMVRSAAKKIERVKGTRDFLPNEMRRRREIERIMRDVATRWGYEEVQTPTFEHAELFMLKSGEGILEEMYEFYDRGGRHIALRPELTAPVMRMFVNELKMARKPLRLFYFGNCFRYEEPQHARYREFWQFGAEIIGADTPEAQAEVIALAHEMLKELRISASIEIGHVGVLRDMLKCICSAYGVSLSDAEENRVMRLIDKGAREQIEDFMRHKGIHEDALNTLFQMTELRGANALDNAYELLESLKSNSDGLRELEALSDVLAAYEVPFTLNLGIARGLEYYTGTVFEIYASQLEAQRQICGGGSYRIAHIFGGYDVPSTGFAFGFDRIAEIFEYDAPPQLKVIVIPVYAKNASPERRKELLKKAIRIASRLRTDFITISDVLGRSLSAQLAYADATGATFAVIIGENEMKAGEGHVTLRNLITGEQKTAHINECISMIHAWSSNKNR